MLSGILDSIPGVGHVKGVCHFIVGDYRAARKSMYEASRSTAVLAGGAAGALGGPAGMIAGAAGAGVAVDTLTSIVTGETQGVISGVADIASDISNNTVPIGSVTRTVLIVGTDIIGGMAGPTVGNCAAKVISESGGKALGKTIIKQVLVSEATLVTKSSVAYGVSRHIQDKTEVHHLITYESGSGSTPSNSSSGTSGGSQTRSSETEPKSKSSSSSGQSSSTDKSKSTSNNGGSSSGGQPPKQNENNNNKKKDNEKDNEKKILAEWEKKLLEIFKKTKLEEIIINGRAIFKELNPWQKKEFKTFIANIKKCEHMDLGGILKIAADLLSQLEKEYATSHNFLNIAKFVLAYVSEELEKRNDAFNQSNDLDDLSTIYNTRLQQLVRNILSDSAGAIVDAFKKLKTTIAELMKTTDPPFVNVIAAIYHYFKHKFNKARNFLLTPVEYFKFASELLTKLKKLLRYQQLRESGETRIIYERYYGNIGRRLVIVIKLQNGKWNLSSVYFEDDSREGDEDGDEWINNEKLPRNCF